MNDSKWIWRSVSLISIVTTALLIVGFVYAVNDIIHPVGEIPQTSLSQQNAAIENGSAEKMKVVALGDSLAKGTGDNTGQGFVKRTVAGLSSHHSKAELIGNMGINGQTTVELQARLAEEGVRYALRQANVILLSIGGNDLFKGSDILMNSKSDQAGVSSAPSSAGTPSGKKNSAKNSSSSANEELSPESLMAAIPNASARLKKILEAITEINPNAQIYYVGLYNPFMDIPDLLVPGNEAVTKWNNAAMDITNHHSNMTVVPTFDLFNRHLDKYLSTDHFHPNSDGYQRISERIIQAVR